MQKTILDYRKKLVKNMTPQERLLFKGLKDMFHDLQKGYHFNLIIRQAVIGWYIADFLLPHKHLIIELDGKQHLKLENRADDIIRDKYFNSLGLDVLRWGNDEVGKNLLEILEHVNLWASLESPISNFFKVKSALKKQAALKAEGRLSRPIRSYDFD